MAQKKAAVPAEEKPSQQEEEKQPLKEPVVSFFTASGIRVNSENQPIDEYGTILDEKPLLRG